MEYMHISPWEGSYKAILRNDRAERDFDHVPDRDKGRDRCTAPTGVVPSHGFPGLSSQGRIGKKAPI